MCLPLPGELRGDALNAVVTQDQVAEVGQVSQFWGNSRDQVPTQIQQLQPNRTNEEHFKLIRFSEQEWKLIKHVVSFIIYSFTVYYLYLSKYPRKYSISGSCRKPSNATTRHTGALQMKVSSRGWLIVRSGDIWKFRFPQKLQKKNKNKRKTPCLPDQRTFQDLLLKENLDNKMCFNALPIKQILV